MVYFFLNLTVGFNLSVGTTVKKLGVVGSGSAASSVTIQSFEWESVWITTAARFFSGDTFDSGFDWASGISGWVEITVVVSVSVVGDWGSRDQESEQVVNEDTFDGAGSGGARVTWVVGLARSESVWTLSGTGVVGDFPWDARFAGGFGVFIAPSNSASSFKPWRIAGIHRDRICPDPACSPLAARSQGA